MGCGGTKVASDVRHTAHSPADADRYNTTQRPDSTAGKQPTSRQRADSGVSVSDPTPPPPPPQQLQQQQQQQAQSEDGGGPENAGIGSATETPHLENDYHQTTEQTDGHVQGEAMERTEREEQVEEDLKDAEHSTKGSQNLGHQQLVVPHPPADRPVKQDIHNSAYWDDVRSDVAGLINDLSSEDQNGRSEGEVQYLALLKHWWDKYSISIPPTHPSAPSLCLDDTAFPLSADTSTMRDWLVSWQPFDLELDELEAPDRAEGAEVTIELGDAHEVFAATLRTFLAEGDSLDFHIQGEAAWNVLPDHVIRDEVMTPEQQKIHEARERRTDLHDEERMRRRREALAQYFMVEREMSPGVVLPFLQWADLLQQNQRALQALCDQQP